jgi:hypothetical protein
VANPPPLFPPPLPFPYLPPAAAAQQPPASVVQPLMVVVQEEEQPQAQAAQPHAEGQPAGQEQDIDMQVCVTS